MSFATLMQAWVEAGRNEEVRCCEQACATLRTKYCSVLKNLDSDPHIEDSLREELLKQFLTVEPTSLGAVESKFQSFCRAHQEMGAVLSLEVQRSVFGHVTTRAKLRARLEIHCQRSGFVLRGATASISALLRRPAAYQSRILKYVKISEYQMWSFYNQRHPDNPFGRASRKAADLRRRLGLGQLSQIEDLIWFTHRLLEHQRARIPTVFDAELNEHFVPGGRTHPLKGKSGLSEAVHPPISGDQIIGAIQEAI
jgi:hypothetical protein